MDFKKIAGGHKRRILLVSIAGAFLLGLSYVAFLTLIVSDVNRGGDNTVIYFSLGDYIAPFFIGFLIAIAVVHLTHPGDRRGFLDTIKISVLTGIITLCLAFLILSIYFFIVSLVFGSIYRVPIEEIVEGGLFDYFIETLSLSATIPIHHAFPLLFGALVGGTTYFIRQGRRDKGEERAITRKQRKAFRNYMISGVIGGLILLVMWEKDPLHCSPFCSNSNMIYSVFGGCVAAVVYSLLARGELTINAKTGALAAAFTGAIGYIWYLIPFFVENCIPGLSTFAGGMCASSGSELKGGNMYIMFAFFHLLIEDGVVYTVQATIAGAMVGSVVKKFRKKS